MRDLWRFAEERWPVLSVLRENSRVTLTNLSRLSGVPISTLHERLKSFDKGYIKKYTCILDYEKMGYSTRANILLKTRKADKDAVIAFLSRCSNINTILKVNNGYDIFVEGIFKNLKDLEDFSEKLEAEYKIRSKQLFFVIEDIKREAFLSGKEECQSIA